MDAGHRTVDETFEVDCPVCAEPVQCTVRALGERRRLFCPAGHELTLRNCAGLDQVIQFLCDLVRTARRCPP
jgi:hypothetical protein